MQEALGNHVAPNRSAPLAAKPSDNLTPEQLAHRAEKAANNKLARETLRKADAGDEKAKSKVSQWMPGVETAVRAAVNEEDGNESKENQNGESAGTENQVEKSAGAEGNEQNETAKEVSKEKAPAKAEDGKHDYVIGGKHMRLTRKDAKRERKIAELKDVDPYTIRNALVNLAQKAWEKSDEKIEPVIFAASEKLRETSKKLIGSEIRIVSVTKNSLEHIRNNHSQNEELRGQKNLTPSDAADIYDTVNDFSSVTLERPDKQGNESMLVVKGKNNRTFVLLVKKGDVLAEVKTLRKTQKKEPPRLLDADKNPPKPNVQNDSGHPVPSSTLTVPQSDQKSKKYTSKSYKVSLNKSFKAITKNGVIVVKDGGRGKGELYENDES